MENNYYNAINKNTLKIVETLSKGKLYFNQIYELSGIKSKNNILKNLNLMEVLKVVKKEKRKGNTFYSINHENSFSTILMQVGNIIKFQVLPFERKRAIEEVIDKTKPTLSILFGSTAKGNFKKDSDIDLLFVFNSIPNKIKENINNISSRYGIRINPIIIKFQNLDLKNEGIKHIFKTGYPISGYNYFYEVLKNV